MNEQDTIGYTKEVIKDVMVNFLFEQADEVTYASMEQSIVSKLVNAFDDANMDIDFAVAVNGDSDGNIGVEVALHDINEDGAVLIRARYTDCPVFTDDNKTSKVINDDATVAFNYAMELVK
jgi:hypothetical protein